MNFYEVYNNMYSFFFLFHLMKYVMDILTKFKNVEFNINLTLLLQRNKVTIKF